MKKQIPLILLIVISLFSSCSFLKKDCKKCNASGKEEVTCYSCDGSGRDFVRGRRNCFTCSGQGEYYKECILCENVPRRTRTNKLCLATNCTGVRLEECQTCSGEGKVYETQQCICGGDGRDIVSCYECEGSGKISRNWFWWFDHIGDIIKWVVIVFIGLGLIGWLGEKFGGD